jgi:adenylate cyclase
MFFKVEFASLDEKARFVPPAWLGADVTQEEFVAGGMLCGKGYEDVAGELARFGYVPIGVS